MSIINTSVTKHPLRLIEVPLNKFKEEVIPHHQQIFVQHKSRILKLLSKNNASEVRQETRNITRIKKQLKDLMYELDTLRAQVENDDLDRFDIKTLSLRKIIITLISGYTDLEKKCSQSLTQQEHDNEPEITNPFYGASHIQIHDDLNELKLQQQKDLLQEVETIEKETQDLNEIYYQLHHMVDHQGEYVDEIEENVENAQVNVNAGLKQLVKAHRLKTAAYPLTGAVLGTVIGGPLGMIAGIKIGGLAALGCAIAGYTGGKLFKKVQEVESTQVEITNTDNIPIDGKNQEKKDI